MNKAVFLGNVGVINEPRRIVVRRNLLMGEWHCHEPFVIHLLCLAFNLWTYVNPFLMGHNYEMRVPPGRDK